MKREIHTDKIKKAVEELIFNASFIAPPEIKNIFREMKEVESLPLAAETLDILIENMEIAEKENIPLCQDCGSVIIFLEIGQQLEITGDYIYDALNSAVADAYSRFYLRKSIVADPLRRINTGTNTPAFIHTDIVPGDGLVIDLMLKGGGSENMSALKMFRPTDSVENIICFIEDTIIAAGPNPCPPLFLGIGIGGTADTAMLNAKKALLKNPTEHNPDPFYRDLELTIMKRANNTNVGPIGFGGVNTVAGVYIKEAPAHIASLPVALNLNCHSFRKGRKNTLMDWKKITTPLTEGVIKNLRCGDLCLITGKILTARDKAHERIKQMTAAGEKLPFSLKGEIIYYVGPTPTKPGEITGAAGPTTSSRMDPFSSMMLELGISGMIGKGKRDRNTKELIQKFHTVYFSSFGGAGAYLSKRIKSSKIIAFDDLASEAVHELIVEDFPVVVAIDMYGEDIYESAVRKCK